MSSIMPGHQFPVVLSEMPQHGLHVWMALVSCNPRSHLSDDFVVKDQKNASGPYEPNAPSVYIPFPHCCLLQVSEDIGMVNKLME